MFLGFSLDGRRQTVSIATPRTHGTNNSNNCRCTNPCRNNKAHFPKPPGFERQFPLETRNIISQCTLADETPTLPANEKKLSTGRETTQGFLQWVRVGENRDELKNGFPKGDPKSPGTFPEPPVVSKAPSHAVFMFLRYWLHLQYTGAGAVPAQPIQSQRNGSAVRVYYRCGTTSTAHM